MEQGYGDSHGVVAVGDSLLNGYGPALGGLSCLSWGGWLAWALTTCLTQHAVNGATAEQVARDQLPLLKGRYRIGVSWLGANDLAGLDTAAFGRSTEAVCASLRACCDTVAIATLPASLRGVGLTGRDAAALNQQVNAQVRSAASRTGAVLVELEDALDGPWSMAPDQVHPTSIGQLEAARRAAVALDRVGIGFARHLPDPADIEVPAVDRRLYAGPLRYRARELWGSAVGRLGERTSARQVAR